MFFQRCQCFNKFYKIGKITRKILKKLGNFVKVKKIKWLKTDNANNWFRLKKWENIVKILDIV